MRSLVLHGEKIGRRSGWLLGVGLVVVGLALARGGWGGSGGASSRMAACTGGWQFAIADLDGDRRPDVASVAVERERAAWTNYAVRLRIGAGPDTYIGVKGPLGGLRLLLRDVNGDNSLDLVLTSVADPHVVEVFLNDGHGNFSTAGTTSFLSIEMDSEMALRAREPGPFEQLLLRTARTAFDVDAEWQQQHGPNDLEYAVAGHCWLAASACELRPKVGRSPPSVLT